MYNIARYWVWRSQLLPRDALPAPGDGRPRTREDGIRLFQALFQRYLRLNPEDWKAAVDSVWATYPEDRIVFNIVPEEDDALQSLVLKELANKNL